jgi:hypothetical protein
MIAGIRPPNGNGTILGRLPDDPELSEIEQAGGTVERHSEAHLVSKGCVFGSAVTSATVDCSLTRAQSAALFPV